MENTCVEHVAKPNANHQVWKTRSRHMVAPKTTMSMFWKKSRNSVDADNNGAHVGEAVPATSVFVDTNATLPKGPTTKAT